MCRRCHCTTPTDFGELFAVIRTGRDTVEVCFDHGSAAEVITTSLVVVTRYVQLYIVGFLWNTLRMVLSERDHAELQAVVGSGSYDVSLSARAQMVLWFNEGLGSNGFFEGADCGDVWGVAADGG
jgi:hypothetical protein